MDPELDRLLLNLQRAVEEMVAEADYDHDRGHQYIVGKTVYREVEAALGAIHEYAAKVVEAHVTEKYNKEGLEQG